MNNPVKDDSDSASGDVIERSFCATVEEFTSPAAREMMGRYLGSFLDPLIITPAELVHSSKYLKRLSDSGRVLMNAVDKVGTLQAKAKSVSVPTRVKELHTLVSAGIRKAWDEDKEKPVPSVNADTFLKVVEGVRQTGAERDRQIGRILAEVLFQQKAWRDKATTLVTLMDATKGTPLFGFMEPWLAEVLRSEPALDQLLGFANRLEDRCFDLSDLWRGALEMRETIAPVVGDINRLIGEGSAPNCKASLEYALLRTLANKDPLRSAEPEIEIQAIFDMFRRLWNGGEMCGGTKTPATLERRQNRYITTEGVTDLLRERKVVADRLAYLLTLSSIAIGPSNRATLKSFIDHYFGDQDFIPRTIGGQEPPVPKMQTLTTIHRALKSSWLPEADKTQAMNRVEAAQIELLKRSRLFEQIDKKGGGPAQKVLTLVDLTRKGTFIEGEPMATVRPILEGYLRDPNFLGEYVAGANGEDRPKKIGLLSKTLASFGITWNAS
jgi:hypothetical protein